MRNSEEVQLFRGGIDMSTERPKRFLRLRQVLDRFPVSRSTWYAGIAAGKYPHPHRLGPRTSGWLEADIEALLDCHAAGKGATHE